MDHPTVLEIERTGYPAGYIEPELYGVDALGNEVLEGDEILVFNDEFFLVDEMSSDAVEALEIIGAETKEA